MNKYKIFIFISIFTLTTSCMMSSENNHNLKTAMLLSEEGNMLKSLEHLLKVLSSDDSSTTSVAEMEDIGDSKKYRKGVTAFNSGNYYDALKIFLNLFFKEPENSVFEYYLKKIHEKIYFIDSEVDYKTTDDLIDFYSLVFRDSFDLKQYIRAYDYFEQLSILSTPRKKIMRKISQIATEMQFVIDHIEDFNLEDFHYAKSYFYFVNGEIENAIFEWEKIVFMNPENFEVNEYLLKFKDVGEKDLFIARKATYFLKIGINLFNDLEYERALVYFEDVLTLDKHNDLADFYIDQIKKKIKEFDEIFAEKEIKKRKEQIEKLKTEKIKKWQVLIKRSKKIKKRLVEDEKKKLETLKEKLNNEENINKKVNGMYREAMLLYEEKKFHKSAKILKKILEYRPNNIKVKKRLSLVKRKT
ncbi:MAG: hypothetical protein GY817_03485 [bacterium]|nr:hypothetical protein [bacterium]